MARTLAWTGLAPLSAYAVFIGGSWFGIYQPGLRIMSVALAAAVLAAWFALALRNPAWRPRSVLLPAIGACLASLVISTVLSRSPGVSVEYLAYAVVLAALYLLLVQLLARDFFRGRFVTLCWALFITTVGIYLVLTVSHWVQWWNVLGRVTIPPLRPEFESLTLGNPSTVLTLVALLAVPIVGSVSWTTQRGIAAVIVVLGLTAVVALLSGSRAGWLALAVAGAVAVAGAAVQPGARSRVRALLARQLATAPGRVLVAGVTGAAVVAIIALAPAILQRMSAGGEGNRIAFVRTALELFAQSPIVGTGPGSWVIQRPRLTLPTEADEYIPHAHNVYAQTLGELGLVGAIAGVVLVLLLLRLVVRAVRDADPPRRRMGWAALIGLVYFAAHQVLDFYPNFPSILIAAAIPVALLDATAARASGTGVGRSPGLGHVPILAGGAVVAVAVAVLVAQELPAMDQAQAVDRANTGDWAAADAPARAAAARDPRISPYLFTAGLTAAHAGDHAAAAAYFRTVTDRDDLPEAWLNLAAEQVELGDTSAALASLHEALRVGYQRPAVAIPAGDLALRIGEQALAIDAFTAAVVNAPSFLGDPWWSQDPDRADVQPAVAAAAMDATGPFVQWEIALMTGDATTARSLAATPGLDPSPVDFVDAWTGDRAAHDRLVGRCRAEPLQLQLLFWCARIEGRRGDDARANEYRYLANVQVGGAYRTGAELRVATQPMAGRTLEGNPAIFWGTYTYRRPTPWDILVPGLVHLTLE